MLRLIFERLSLIVLGLCLPLILLEGIFRFLDLAPPAEPNPAIWEEHPELGWWHLPESGGTFYSSFGEYETEVYINAMRLRDDPDLVSYDLPEDTLRLLILADSYGEALEVPLEKTFFKGVEARLETAGRPVQTINAGVGSWGTDQELTFYRLEGRRYKPDLTLLFFYTGNDVVNNYAPLEVSRTGGAVQKPFYQLDETGALLPPAEFDRDDFQKAFQAEMPAQPRRPAGEAPLTGVADWLWLHSHTYRWGSPYLQDLPPILRVLGPTGILGGQAYISTVFPGQPVTFYVYQASLTSQWAKAWTLTEALLVELQTQVRADGGVLAVILIPTREQVYPEQWQRLLTRQPELKPESPEMDWDLTWPNQHLGQILAENEIAYLDLLPAFRQAAARPETPRLYLTRNGHWTEAGHALAAEQVYAFLCARPDEFLAVPAC